MNGQPSKGNNAFGSQLQKVIMPLVVSLKPGLKLKLTSASKKRGVAFKSCNTLSGLKQVSLKQASQ
jgi:hypothetical protein